MRRVFINTSYFRYSCELLLSKSLRDLVWRPLRTIIFNTINMRIIRIVQFNINIDEIG